MMRENAIFKLLKKILVMKTSNEKFSITTDDNKV